MSRLSLRTRLTSLTVIVVAVILGAFSVVLSTQLSDFLLGRTDDQLRHISENIGTRLVDQIGGVETGRPKPGNPGGQDPPPLRPAGVPAGTQAQLVGPSGEVRGSWDLAAGSEADSPAVKVPDEVRKRANSRHEAVFFTSGRYRVYYDSQNRGTDVQPVSMLVAIPIDDVRHTTDRLRTLLLVGGVSGVAVAGLLGLLFVKLGLRPLQRVTDSARRVSRGERGIRVGGPYAATEVGALASSFDQMLGDLESAVATAQASEARTRRFVADAAHELRTPLASVRGHAELLRRGMSDPELVRDAAVRIEGGAERLGGLVEQMLALARLDAAAPLDVATVDLRGLAAEAVADADVRHPDHVFVVAEGEPVPVLGDRLRLRQLLDNVLVNAGRHTPPGTTTTVAAESDGDTARVSVTDDGPGFGDTGGVDLFGRFARTDASRTRDTGGSGLGLAIVRGVAEAHGGTATATSSPGGGVTITVTLPIAGPPTATGEGPYAGGDGPTA